MLSRQQLTSMIIQLPVDERLKILDVLEDSVSEHLDRLAEDGLRHDLAIVKQRLADLDADLIIG